MVCALAVKALKYLLFVCISSSLSSIVSNPGKDHAYPPVSDRLQVLNDHDEYTLKTFSINKIDSWIGMLVGGEVFLTINL